MADEKITELAALGAQPDDADIIPIVDDPSGSPVTKKVTVANLLAGAGGGGAKLYVSTIFEAIGRFLVSKYNGGDVQISSSGIIVDSGATQAAGGKCRLGDNWRMWERNSAITWWGDFIYTNGSDYESFVGAGSVTVHGENGVTFTDKQYGFKLVRASSGATVFSLTNGNGATETATADAADPSVNSMYRAAHTVGTNVKYYHNKVLLTTHTTNLPVAESNQSGLTIGVSNVNVASESAIRLSFFTYEEDAEP